jgi:hypothetical protein
MTSMLRKAVIAGGAALLSVAAAAIAADIPTGVISDAAHARVDNVDATLGANIYAGDALQTFENGTLRMRVGSGQLFMLASSQASMTQDHALIDMMIRSGTVGLSATNADPLEIDTPVGTVRPADAKHAFGQVTILSQHQIAVTSYSGTLALTRNKEVHLIEAGKSYRVSLPASAAPAAAAAPPSPQSPSGAGSGGGGNGQLVFDSVVVGSAAVAGYVLWTIFCESPSTPPSN